MRYPTSEMAKRRGPYSDPRRGRVRQEIEHAFAAHNTDVLPTSVLLGWAYGAPPRLAIIFLKPISGINTSYNPNLAEVGKPTRWPGQSGNPAGKPPGTRTAFAQGFIRDFAPVWAEEPFAR